LEEGLRPPEAQLKVTQLKVTQLKVAQLKVAQLKVAQVFNLLYRRLSACRLFKSLLREPLATLARDVSKLGFGGHRERRR
jgi:hypothetical protein